MNSSIVWFRHDLRLTDNPAFIEAFNNSKAIIPLYIYDEANSVLGEAQKWWLHHSLMSLDKSLQEYGLSLVLRKGNPLQIILELSEQLGVEAAVYWNRCYEPQSIERDKQIKSTLLQKGILATSSNGTVLNEPWTIKNKSGDYFKVFTPYWRECLKQIRIPLCSNLSNRPNKIIASSDELSQWKLLPSLSWASRFADYWQPGEQGAQKKLNDFIDNNLKDYKINRDIPKKDATSRLSPHLHFGEISPWKVYEAIEFAKLDASCDIASAERFLSELGWREFSVHLLYHFPKLPQANFKEAFNAFPWNDDASSLKRWQKGMTGYPIVDAGMRELWATGYMHNRVRMIVASFLTKHLLIDWRLGADWFLDTLVDADLANNSASWQWVAGCGADAAPYFRIFNPILQSQKFDPDGVYIRQWVPELAQLSNQYLHQPWTEDTLLKKGYPEPIIAHEVARKRALECYKQIKN